MLCLASCGGEPDRANRDTAGSGRGPSSSEDVAVAGATAGSLPDFGAIEDVAALKRTFYHYLHPLVVAENSRILSQRRRLEQLQQQFAAGSPLSGEDRTWMLGLAATYDLEGKVDSITTGLVDSLLRRVDVVPAPLALAQAAIESGWGRSRFARRGNNIFGEWCFSPGCGIVPRQRSPGAAHEIADFDTPALSIRSYLNNLNTHPAYTDWRLLRQRQRTRGRLDAHELAAELTAYSTLREEYVQRVRTVMRQNRHLMPSP